MRSATFLALAVWGAVSTDVSTSSTCDDADGNSLLQAKKLVRRHTNSDAHDLLKSLRNVAATFTEGSEVSMTPTDVNAALDTANSALQTMFPLFEEQRALAEQQLAHAVAAVQACHSGHGGQARAHLDEELASMTAARTECEQTLANLVEAENEACAGQGDAPNCACNEARVAVTDQTEVCVAVTETHGAVFCEHHVSCTMHEHCYERELEVYNTLRADVEAASAVRELEYVAYMQSQCIMNLITQAMLRGTPIPNSDLLACGDVDVHGLSIPHPEVPPPPAECPVHSDDPDCVHFLVLGCPDRHPGKPLPLARGTTGDVRCCSLDGDSCNSGNYPQTVEFTDGSVSQGTACGAGDCRNVANTFCHSGLTFTQGVEICAQQGQRLCTQDELDGGVCCNNGCGHNAHYIWVSEITD